MTAIEAIKQADAAKQKALATLHVELGYESAQDLARDIMQSIATENGRVTPRGVVKLAKVVLGDRPASGNARKGRRVPDETRKAIAAALKAGRVASSLPAHFGVSYNIVHAIKTELGMTTPRKRGRK